MRFLVIDDHVHVELALAQVIRDTEHTLVGVRDPQNLPEVLAEEPGFDAAFVDLSFGRQAPTGLSAMITLRQMSPATRLVMETTEEERNRLLYLMAAFVFFEPVGLMPKNLGAEEMRALITLIARGEALHSMSVDRLVRHGDDLHRLVRDSTDLALWRALARFDRRGEVARASYVEERTVDRFTARQSVVLDLIDSHFPEPASVERPFGQADPADEQRHRPNLMRLARFAETHGKFFDDSAVESLFAARWAER